MALCVAIVAVAPAIGSWQGPYAHLFWERDYTRARALLGEGSFEDASPIAERALVEARHAPQSPAKQAACLSLLAEIAERGGHLPEAISYMRAALKAAADQAHNQRQILAPLTLSLATALFQSGALTEARDSALKALRIFNDLQADREPAPLLAIRLAQTQLLLGRIEARIGRKSQAKVWFERAVMTAQESALAEPTAETARELLAEMSPGSQRAVLLEHGEDTVSPAAMIWEKFARATGTGLPSGSIGEKEGLLLAARALIKQGRYAEAEELLTGYVAAHPNDLDAALLLERSLNNQRKYAACERLLLDKFRLLNRSKTETKTEIRVIRRLHALYLSLGRPNRAIPLLERHLELLNDNPAPSIQKADNMFFLAGAHVQQGHWQKAEQWYIKSLSQYEQVLDSEHPSIAICLHEYAKLLAQQKKLDASSRAFARAEAIWRKNPDTNPGERKAFAASYAAFKQSLNH